MVEQYNKAARNQALSEQQMYAIQGDLTAPKSETTHPSLNSEDFFGFDVIVMSMALHHVEDPQEMLTRLVERLKDGGVVVIIDWNPNPERRPDQRERMFGEGDSAQDLTGGHGHGLDRSHGEGHSHEGAHIQRPEQHAAAHTVATDGFNKEQMDTMLRRAGCREVEYVLHPELSRVPPSAGGYNQLFFARGRK